MPVQEDNLNVTLSKLLKVVGRRRWWVIAPAFVIAMGAFIAALLIPNSYQSDATILVEQQRVPERYVTPNNTYDMRAALLLMADTTLSRSRLLQIINEFGLYPKTKEILAPEDLVTMMRQDITIAPLFGKAPENRDLNAFKISFKAAEPHLAQDVTNRLTTLIIEGNLRSREEQSAGTTRFLEDQLQSATTDLKLQQDRVRDFKMRHLGQLPEQQQGNLQILAGMQVQLQNTMSSLARAREQQVYLESLLSQYQSLASAMGASPGTPAATANDATRAELSRLTSLRSDLVARYTARYPDVVKLDGQIKELRAQLAASMRAAEAAEAGSAIEKSTPSDSMPKDRTTAQIKSQLEANRMEIQNALADQKQIQARIGEYQQRINMTPVREQELGDALRDYNLSKQNYDDLLNKKTQSELATSLERHQQGQQFRIIDPPSLPTKPASPDHTKVSLGGLLAGIIIGLALAFLVEARDTSIRDEKDLGQHFAFPLMVGLPVLLSKVEETRQARWQVVEWFAGAALCLLVCAAEFYILRRG